MHQTTMLSDNKFLSTAVEAPKKRIDFRGINSNSSLLLKRALNEHAEMCINPGQHRLDGLDPNEVQMDDQQLPLLDSSIKEAALHPQRVKVVVGMEVTFSIQTCRTYSFLIAEPEFQSLPPTLW